MNHREYTRVLAEDVRYRVDFDKDHGHVVRFVVQLEVAIDEQWQPVRRYDTAHGFAHCDLYRRDGSVLRHQPMAVGDYDNALTMATQIVRDNGVELAHNFLEQTL